MRREQHWQAVQMTMKQHTRKVWRDEMLPVPDSWQVMTNGNTTALRSLQLRMPNSRYMGTPLAYLYCVSVRNAHKYRMSDKFYCVHLKLRLFVCCPLCLCTSHAPLFFLLGALQARLQLKMLPFIPDYEPINLIHS